MRLKRVGLMTEPCGVPLSKECNSKVGCDFYFPAIEEGSDETEGVASNVEQMTGPDQRLSRC
jgi:hypothetical protein